MLSEIAQLETEIDEKYKLFSSGQVTHQIVFIYKYRLIYSYRRWSDDESFKLVLAVHEYGLDYKDIIKHKFPNVLRKR